MTQTTTTTTTYWALIDNDGCIWGVGSTPEECEAQARDTLMTDHMAEEDQAIVDVEGMRTVLCTPRLYQYVTEHGWDGANDRHEDIDHDHTYSYPLLDLALRYYRASDDAVSEDYEAYTWQEAVALARASWESAAPGTYQVTIYEYLTEDARAAHGSSSYHARAYETITVEVM